jgi:FkbM family methyltransferase
MILNLDTLKRRYDLKIQGVIHVGAHTGEEHDDYKRLGIENLVYFEPVKNIFEILKKRVGNDAKLYNLALGNENRDIEMFVEKIDRYGCSSILKPSSNYSHIPFLKNQKATMKRLDDIGLDRCYNFLNIDVQGYELEVLKGSKETLNSIDYIMCEINRITPRKKLDYHNASLIEDLCSFLGQYGFMLVEEDWAGVSWGDGFFIKRDTNESN